MAETNVNLGRVRGGGMYYSSGASQYAVPKTLVSSPVNPLAGDLIEFANGDVRQIVSIDSTNYICGDVLYSLKGEKGDDGADGAEIRADGQKVNTLNFVVSGTTLIITTT